MFSYNIHDQHFDYLTNEELLDKWLLKINKVSLNVAKSKYMKCHHLLTLHNMTICNTANNKNMCCAKASSQCFLFVSGRTFSDDDDFVN